MNQTLNNPHRSVSNGQKDGICAEVWRYYAAQTAWVQRQLKQAEDPRKYSNIDAEPVSSSLGPPTEETSSLL